MTWQERHGVYYRILGIISIGLISLLFNIFLVAIGWDITARGEESDNSPITCFLCDREIKSDSMSLLFNKLITDKPDTISLMMICDKCLKNQTPKTLILSIIKKVNWNKDELAEAIRYLREPKW